MADPSSLDEFNALLEQTGNGVPNAGQYHRMSSLILTFPQARKLPGMNPFKPGYKEAAMELYLSLRGRAEQGYLATRGRS